MLSFNQTKRGKKVCDSSTGKFKDGNIPGVVTGISNIFSPLSQAINEVMTPNSKKSPESKILIFDEHFFISSEHHCRSFA